MSTPWGRHGRSLHDAPLTAPTRAGGATPEYPRVPVEYLRVPLEGSLERALPDGNARDGRDPNTKCEDPRDYPEYPCEYP